MAGIRSAVGIVVAAAILALVGADFGLHTAVIFFCGEAVNSAANNWCPQTISEQRLFAERVLRNVSDTKIADILLVIFTYFLVRVGSGQREIMSKQAIIAEGQTEILRKQLLADGPFLGYDIHKLEIKADDPEKTKLRDYKISLQWKNSGRDIATNVTYWQGPIFRAGGQDGEQDRQKIADDFRDTIFRAELPSGHVAVQPGGTVETDRIVLSPDHLRALFRKQIRFFVWCVLAYRSRLQSDRWFEEIAIYLEFVLDRDPDTYGLSDKNHQGSPFKVAIIGYRQRTVDKEQKG